jgi:hypothetical protein
MKKLDHESQDDFETRQWQRRKGIVSWSTVGVIAGVIVALDIIMGWNTKVQQVFAVPARMDKISDIVWEDHQAILRIEDTLNIQHLESPKEQGELQSLLHAPDSVILAANTTNAIDP